VPARSAHTVDGTVGMPRSPYGIRVSRPHAGRNKGLGPIGHVISCRGRG
jgi:hypothetical protein